MSVRTFIRFIKECIKELLYIIGTWIKANILAFCWVTAFFVFIIGIEPIDTVEDVIVWLICYIFFIFVTFGKKPNLQRARVQDRHDKYDKVSIQQRNISLISLFKNTKK